MPGFTYQRSGGAAIVLSAESTAAYQLGITEVIAAVQAYAIDDATVTNHASDVFGHDLSFIYRAYPPKPAPVAPPPTVLGALLNKLRG